MAARSVLSPDSTATTSAPSPVHAVDVGRLPFDVDGTHVHTAGQPDARAGCGRCNAVLPCAGLRNHLLRAKPPGEQCLSDRVVDFVCARMRKVLALEPDFCAPAVAQPGRKRQGGGPANPLAKLPAVRLLEVGVVQVLAHALFELLERRHQRFGDIPPSERAESPAVVRQLST